MPEGKRRDLTQVRLINVKESVCSGRVFRSRFFGKRFGSPAPWAVMEFRMTEGGAMGKMNCVKDTSRFSGGGRVGTGLTNSGRARGLPPFKGTAKSANVRNYAARMAKGKKWYCLTPLTGSVFNVIRPVHDSENGGLRGRSVSARADAEHFRV